MRAKRVACIVCPSSSMLIAQVVLLLEHGHTQTHKVTDAADHRLG